MIRRESGLTERSEWVASNGSERQLLAIMFTDIVGYTAITERSEDEAIRIRDAHRRLLRTTAQKFGGDVVDATGDESLSVFSSALNAVDCALAVQAALVDDPLLKVRIGIHLGDVLRRGSEVIGEGVNVAARIRPLAAPGGICVSEAVEAMIRSRPHVSATSLGARTFKNVAQPINVFVLEPAADAGTRSAPSRRLSLASASLAVAILVGVMVWFRGPVIAWLALNVPRLTGGSVDQQIGFATTSDGVKIAYATSGDGPPMVNVLGWGTHLTEGLGSPLYDNSGRIAFWSERFTLVRYDGRGFGLSDRDVHDFSIEARVRDLEAVVDALGVERFVLNAFSAGGPTGVAYAARHPDKVSKLILAATYAGRGGAGSVPDSNIAALLNFVETSWQSNAARAAFVEYLAPEATDVERRVFMHFLTVAANGPQVAGFLRATGSDVTASAVQIRCPTLVVASDADRAVPLRWSRELAALIPGARLEIVAGASHRGATGDDPRAREVMAAFLREGAGDN